MPLLCHGRALPLEGIWDHSQLCAFSHSGGLSWLSSPRETPHGHRLAVQVKDSATGTCEFLTGLHGFNQILGTM